MNSIPKVSVIIPIYNVERYIERCTRSLMEQTMHEGIEFIFINDCTPDRSMDVLQRVITEYPERKAHIRIINHIVNKGIAYTRGEGMLEAKGEYIGWCDSDDWCEKDMYAKMLEQAENCEADIVACNHVMEYEKYSEEKCSIYVEDKTLLLDKLYKSPHFFFPLWDTLMKKQLLQENGIEPFENVNIAEDVNICLRAIYYAKRIVKMDNHLYHYSKTNSNSIMTNEHEDLLLRWKQNKENTDRICQFFLQKDKRCFRKMCNYLRFKMKNNNSEAFDSMRDYYYMYSESHKYIMFFTAIPLVVRIKLSIIYSHYYVFALYKKLKSS